MPYIVWQKNFEVNVPSIDVQHRKLIGIINDLYERIRGQQGSSGIVALLDEMSLYAETHFRHEEALLESVRYPGLDDQKSNHRMYRDRVEAMRQSFQKQPVVVLDFLKEWWQTHITVADMQYKDTLKGKP